MRFKRLNLAQGRKEGMQRRFVRFLSVISGALLLIGGYKAQAEIPGPPTFASNYQKVWAQDFSTMKTLADLRVSDNRVGEGTWIAHKPGGGDWFTFQNPKGDMHPFGIGNGYLTIRVQKDGSDPNNWFSGYSGGLLSSMDETGKGFAQKYGYFECSMWCPGTPNTWPAFWMLDAPSLTDKKLNSCEIDVTESYGNFGAGPGNKPAGDPNQNTYTWHLWRNDGKPHVGIGSFSKGEGMTTGFHTYGVDVEPTGITWYYDRKKVWSAAIYEEAQRPLFVMVNLALGGGNHNNAKGDNYDWTLTPDPTDLKVKYVAVWASPASPNFNGPPVPPAEVKARAGNEVVELNYAVALGADTYNIYRGTAVNGENASPIATGVKTTTYIDKKLKNGDTYYYKIASVNAKGVSPKSSEASAAPKFGKPIDPTELVGVPGDGRFSLTWNPSPDAVSYNVYRGTTIGGEGKTAIASGIKDASFTDKGLQNGTPCFYTVSAVSTGGVSGSTNEVNGIPASTAETIAVAYAKKAPIIDGSVDAIWKSALVYSINKKGLGEATTTNGVCQVMWDAANLYCLFTVNDSATVNGTPDFNGDAVELYLDAGNTKSNTYNATDFRFTLGFGHTTISEYAHKATDGVKFAQSLYPGGYREEIMIPWATLKVTPYEGLSMGLDAAIDEAPTVARGRTTALFWQDGTANDYQNPQLFGNGTLMPKTDTAALANGIYKIINVKSGKALEVPGASKENVKLDQATYKDAPNMQWMITDLGGGSYSIQNVNSSSVLDCSPTFDYGHPAVQWPINGTPSATQRFTITAIKGHYILTCVYSGKLLDVQDSSSADGAAVIQALCTATGSQLWDLVKVK